MSPFKTKKTVAAASPDAREVFMRAAEIVRTKWTYGHFIDEEGGQCLVQALGTAIGGMNMKLSDSMLPHEYLALIDVKLSAYECYRTARADFASCDLAGDSLIQTILIDWNDTKGRTKSEVAGLLESIARDLASAATATDELQQMSDDLDRLWDTGKPVVHATMV